MLRDFEAAPRTPSSIRAQRAPVAARANAARLQQIIGNRAARRLLARRPSIQRVVTDVGNGVSVNATATAQAGAFAREDGRWRAPFNIDATGRLTGADADPDREHFFGIIQNANSNIDHFETVNGRNFHTNYTTGGWRLDAGDAGDEPWYDGNVSQEGLDADTDSAVSIADAPQVPFTPGSTNRSIDHSDLFEWWLVHALTNTPTSAADVQVLQSGTLTVNWEAGTTVTGGGANATPRHFTGPAANDALVMTRTEMVPPPLPAQAPSAPASSQPPSKAP